MHSCLSSPNGHTNTWIYNKAQAKIHKTNFFLFFLVCFFPPSMRIISSASFNSTPATRTPFHHLLFDTLDTPLLDSSNTSCLLPNPCVLSAIAIQYLILSFLPLHFHSLASKVGFPTSPWRCQVLFNPALLRFSLPLSKAQSIMWYYTHTGQLHNCSCTQH